MASNSDVCLKKKGGDYATSLSQNRMKRRDYEINNMSFENIRPLYNISSIQNFENMSQGNIQEEEPPIVTKIDKMKRQVSHSLLINKPQYIIEESESDKDYEQQKPSRGRIVLPKLREKFTLHITNHGPRLVKRG